MPSPPPASPRRRPRLAALATLAVLVTLALVGFFGGVRLRRPLPMLEVKIAFLYAAGARS